MPPKRLPGEPPLSPLYPMRVFVLVILTVFVVEGSVMTILPHFSIQAGGAVWFGLADACILTFVTGLVVWFLAVKPLRGLFEARGRLLQRIFEAQEQERSRIARDLHDGIGQHLTALLVGLRTVEESSDLATARERARDFRELGAMAHEEVRRLVRGLHPMVLEELGLAPAIERLCFDFQRVHDVKLNVSCALSEHRMEMRIESALYRIVQEALANIARHSQAKEVELWLAQDEKSVNLMISDDGKGIPDQAIDDAIAEKGSFGLGSMRERVLALSGEFSLRSGPGQGTTIEVWIPIAG